MNIKYLSNKIMNSKKKILAQEDSIDFSYRSDSVVCGSISFPLGNLEITLLSYHWNCQSAGLAFDTHDHPYYELAFMRCGGMSSFCDNHRIDCYEDMKNIFFMPPLVPHSRRFGKAEVNINETMVLMIKGSNESSQMWANQLLPELARKLHYTCPLTPGLDELRELYYHHLTGDHFNKDIAREILKSFLTLFFIGNFPELFETKNIDDFAMMLNSDRISSIKTAVEYGVNTSRPLSYYAERFNISLHHLNRLFKDKTGMTIYQYQKQRKLELAESMLTTTNTSIAEVSYVLGFKTAEQFTVFFRKHHGMPPSEYRKKFWANL